MMDGSLSSLSFAKFDLVSVPSCCIKRIETPAEFVVQPEIAPGNGNGLARFAAANT